MNAACKVRHRIVDVVKKIVFGILDSESDSLESNIPKDSDYIGLQQENGVKTQEPTDNIK